MQKTEKPSLVTLKEIGQYLLFVLLCIGAVHFTVFSEEIYHIQLGLALALWAYGVVMHIATKNQNHFVLLKSVVRKKKFFDFGFYVTFVVAVLMIFSSNIAVNQMGFSFGSCAFVLWCSVRITGPHLEQKKQNRQE